MRLVRAEEVTLRKRKQCASCDEIMPISEVVWLEVWDDGSRDRVEYYHLQCDGDDETREEYREEMWKV
jgi:hypothetical protein